MSEKTTPIKISRVAKAVASFYSTPVKRFWVLQQAGGQTRPCAELCKCSCLNRMDTKPAGESRRTGRQDDKTMLSKHVL